MNTFNSFSNIAIGNKNISLTPPIVFLNFTGDLTNTGSQTVTISYNGTIDYDNNNAAIFTGNSNNYIYFTTPSMPPRYSICALVNIKSGVINNINNYSFLSINYNNSRGFILYNNSSFKFMNSFGNQSNFTSTKPSENVYLHIVIVYTSYYNCITYFNGDKIGEANVETPQGNSVFNIFIGKSSANTYGNNDGNLPFTGKISKFQFYNYALNDNQVKDVYNNRDSTVL